MTAGFDIHEVRHRVKLLRDDGDTMLVENRDGDGLSGLRSSDIARYDF